MLRPENYPKINIDFKSFCDQLNINLVNPIKNISTLNMLYSDYKECQYHLKLEYVLIEGYELVKDWMYSFLQDWNLDDHETQLRAIVDKNGWIKIDKDLKYTWPKLNEDVLTFSIHLEQEIRFLDFINEFEKHIFNSNTIMYKDISEITHYQLLPKPPIK